MINKVFLIGNLGKDPEVRRLESGSTVAKFSLATNENYKDKAGEWQTITEWHNIVIWRAQAERAEKELKKGSLAYVEGKLTHRSYKDKDGNDRYITEVVANTYRLLEKRESGGRSYGDNFPGIEDEIKSQPFTGPTTTIPEPQKAEGQLPPDDDDLPF